MICLKKAQFFGVLFDKAPKYEDTNVRTLKTPHFTGVNSLFAHSGAEKSHLVSIPAKGWNSLCDSLIELDSRLKEIDNLGGVTLPSARNKA
jgi:hypothetical protein